MASQTHSYLSSPTAPATPSTVKFTSYIGRNLEVGYDTNGREANYVPPSKLRDYWTHTQIQEVLREHNLILDAQAIRDWYLRVFSILVYIGAVTYLTDVFTDHERADSKFPEERCPWEAHPAYESLWPAFNKYQWKFFPLELRQRSLLGTVVATKRILPWKRSCLRDSNTSTVYRIDIHKSCNQLLEDPHSRLSKPNTFVLKTYSERGEAMYNKERKAFEMLSSKPSENIIAYYGAFQQDKTYNLILELASGGDLLAYMESTPPPLSAQDIYAFWSSFNSIFRGLFEVHKTTERAERNGGGGGNVLIVHEDIKPENILLEILDNNSSRYDFIPKLADFGYSSVRNVPANAEDDRLGLDNHGSPTYSAPEISHQERYMQEGRYRLSELADIWSMGCVLSELCVWVALGTKGRDEYTRLRRDETSKIKSCKGSAYRSCFHNGISALEAVATMHARAIGALPSTDSVTRGILKVVTEHMLVISAQRWPADTIRLKIGHILDIFEANGIIPRIPNAQDVNGNASMMADEAKSTTAALPSTTRNISSLSAPSGVSPYQDSTTPSLNGLGSVTPAITLPPPSTDSIPLRTTKPHNTRRFSPHNLAPLNTSSAPQSLSLSLEDLRTWRHAEKNNLPLDNRIARAINGLREQLRSRDHIFFFENSPSMEQYRNEAIDAFVLLSYLAKKIDSNGIELVFSNEPSKFYKSKDTTPLIDRLKRRSFSPINLMESNLGEFFQNIVIPRLPQPSNPSPISSLRPRRASNASAKSLSIFVLTDGQWGDSRGRAAGIEAPVEKIMAKILERGLNRTQVMLQFVRFGNDANGEQCLQYLDDFGKELGCDIVDTEPISGNVFKIFIGSINLAMDDSLSPASKETMVAG